ncbi:MAG TPA: hypothetical protein VM490_16095 [Armatimonadaceae bacterium]|nr:hypothetical protein [Armatimonadaceae bacterium]
MNAAASLGAPYVIVLLRVAFAGALILFILFLLHLLRQDTDAS